MRSWTRLGPVRLPRRSGYKPELMKGAHPNQLCGKFPPLKQPSASPHLTRTLIWTAGTNPVSASRRPWKMTCHRSCACSLSSCSWSPPQPQWPQSSRSVASPAWWANVCACCRRHSRDTGRLACRSCDPGRIRDPIPARIIASAWPMPMLAWCRQTHSRSTCLIYRATIPAINAAEPSGLASHSRYRSNSHDSALGAALRTTRQ